MASSCAHAAFDRPVQTALKSIGGAGRRRSRRRHLWRFYTHVLLSEFVGIRAASEMDFVGAGFGEPQTGVDGVPQPRRRDD